MGVWPQLVHHHYRTVWGIDGDLCRIPGGPVRELPEGFEVRKFQPTGSRSNWTYGTCGMGLPADGTPLELHLFSKVESPGLVELLTVIAHFHRTGARLGLGHTVNFGRGWLPGSGCDHGLVSLPYLDGPKLENVGNADFMGRCLWLIPITKAEVEYKKAFGLESLEQRFEAAQFDYADPHRASVA